MIERNNKENESTIKKKKLHKIRKLSKNKKTNDYFNSIINGYYNIDYEKMPEYKQLIEEYDFFDQISLGSTSFEYYNKFLGL